MTTAKKAAPPPIFAAAPKYWGAISKLGVFLAAIVGAFALPPPADLSHAGGIRPEALARYAMFLMLAFCWLWMLRWNKKTHATRWMWAGAACFAVSLIVSFAYLDSIQSRTANYDGQRVVIGSQYTPAAARVAQLQPTLSAEALLFDAAGEVGAVWTGASIAANVRWILALYMLLFISAGVAILSVLHAIWLRSSPPAKRSR